MPALPGRRPALPRQRIPATLNVIDSLVVAQVAAGMRSTQMCSADADGSGFVSIIDALTLAQAAAGLRILLC